MIRGIGGASGHVVWPSEETGYTDTGEGGLWAYVFIAAEHENGADDFEDCTSPSGVIMLPLQDVISHDRGQIYDPRPGMQSYPQLPRHPATHRPLDMVSTSQAQTYGDALQSYERSVLDAGANVLAAACLGSTGNSWFSSDLGEYFEVTYQTLDPQGQALVDALELFYRRSPYYVTYLDT